MRTDTKWYKTMLKKYGSEEAVKQEMARRQAKSRETYGGGGGFAHLKMTDPEKFKEITAKGGKRGKRGKAKNV